MRPRATVTTEPRRVEAADWHEAVARAVASHPRLVGLVGWDDIGGSPTPTIAVWARFEGPGDAVELLTTVARNEDRHGEQGHLASVVDVVAGARWYEREIHDMLGVVFDGGDRAPLLVRPESLPEAVGGCRVAPPLLKDALLVERAATPWPGAQEPTGGARAGRRAAPPPGVPQTATWQRLREGEEVPAEEVAAELAGTRVRRRGGTR